MFLNIYVDLFYCRDELKIKVNYKGSFYCMIKSILYNYATIINYDNSRNSLQVLALKEVLNNAS